MKYSYDVISDGKTESIVLDKLKYVVMRYLTKEFIDELGILPEIDFSNHVKFICDDTAMRIRQDILAEHLETVEVKYPADWWQAFKERWFPKWLQKYYPINEKIEIIEVMAYYPKLPIPGQDPLINAHKRYEFTIPREEW